jgi:hypothetical protein
MIRASAPAIRSLSNSLFDQTFFRSLFCPEEQLIQLHRYLDRKQ